jgi:hypothetical protein
MAGERLGPAGVEIPPFGRNDIGVRASIADTPYNDAS